MQEHQQDGGEHEQYEQPCPDDHHDGCDRVAAHGHPPVRVRAGVPEFLGGLGAVAVTAVAEGGSGRE